MLRKADEAVVVTNSRNLRSKSMEPSLAKYINKGLQAPQALLRSDATLFLNITRLSLIYLADQDIFDAILRRRQFQFVCATDKNSARLLTTPTRDAGFNGPAPREAHRRVGWYLATEFLSDMIGVEEYRIPHVQGGQTHSHRLLREEQTLIVPLMRGGEPMAFGVNDAFPLAMFLHARYPDDIKPEHLQVQGMRTVVLLKGNARCEYNSIYRSD